MKTHKADMVDDLVTCRKCLSIMSDERLTLNGELDDRNETGDSLLLVQGWP